jgi:hypothetical protein
LTSAPRTPTQKRKRTIRLRMEKNEIFPIPHIDDFDQDVIRATWYEKSEYDVMKVGFVATIKKMMRGEHIEENNVSTIRGLEFRTRKGALRRQHNKLSAITAVLDEQDRQFNGGTFDDERLAEVYRSSGSHCQENAHVMAVKDEETMKEIMAEISEPVETKSNEVSVEPVMTFKRNLTAGDSVRKTEKKQIAITQMFKQSRIQRRAMLGDAQTGTGKIELPLAA